MTKCSNFVDTNCHCCQNTPVKYGKSQHKQRYYCKSCKKTWLAGYTRQACLPSVNSNIVALVKEGCGIRSIARLLNISATTVIDRIQKIAAGIKKPAIVTEKVYEVDELKTYVKKKTNDYWVIYVINKESKQIVDFKAGKRTKKNLKKSYRYLAAGQSKTNIYRRIGHFQANNTCRTA